MSPQFGEIEFECLIKEFGMLLIPPWHGGIESREDHADLVTRRRKETTTCLLIKFEHLRRANAHFGYFSASIDPKLQPLKLFLRLRGSRRGWD